jgi:hypothetical protein
MTAEEFARYLEDRILGTVSQMLADRESPIAHRGIVMPGSYDPTDGTIEVLIGNTYALIGDDGDVPATLKKVPLLSTMVGDLSAPIGGERVIIHRDFGAILHHGPDDTPGTATNGSPGAVLGERIIAHRNPTTLTFDAWRHYTNDGSTAGDGLAGVRDFSGAYHKTFTAAGHEINADDTVGILQAISAKGHKLKLDDANKVASIVTTGGMQHVLSDALQHIAQQTTGGHLHILDDAGKVIKTVTKGGLSHIFDDVATEISHLAPNVTLGARLANLTTDNNALHIGHLDTFNTSLLAQRLADQVLLVGLLHGVGTMTTGQLSQALISLVAGFLPKIGLPSGSSIVKIAN